MLDRDLKDGCDLSKCSLPTAIKFDSRSEYAIAVLFERYFDGWKTVTGETFQIPIGNKRIDFLVQNTFVEFHPIMINRELKSEVANTLFRQIYKRSNRFERGQLVDMLVAELSAQYTARRGQLIAQSEHRSKHFVVCRNEYEVYRHVICRFAKEPPSIRQFKKEFSEAVASA